MLLCRCTQDNCFNIYQVYNGGLVKVHTIFITVLDCGILLEMDAKTIKHIASLARIGVTSKEEEKMKGELSSILDYIAQLNKVDTGGVDPLYQTTGLVNSMRPDEPGKSFPADEKLIKQAPENEERFVKVKPVLNK